jgi:hypothetical protein
MVGYGEDYKAWLGKERITKHGWVWRGLPSMVGYGEDYKPWLGMERITNHGWVWRGLPSMVGYGEDSEKTTEVALFEPAIGTNCSKDEMLNNGTR